MASNLSLTRAVTAPINHQGASSPKGSSNDSSENVSGFVQGRLDSIKRRASDDWSSDGAAAPSEDWGTDEEGGNATQTNTPEENPLDIVVRYNELGIETSVPVAHPAASTAESELKIKADDVDFPTNIGSSVLKATRQRRSYVGFNNPVRKTYERTPQEKEKMERQISEAAARVNKTFRFRATGETLEYLGLIKS